MNGQGGMEYRRLGTSGLQVSALAFGTHDLHLETSDRALVRKAFDHGINFFDTACSYGEEGASEKLLGELIADLPRDRLVVATKVRFGYGPPGPNQRGLGRKHIRHSLETSLKRLRLDFLDLYVLHQWDPESPVEETVAMMADLIRQGKILYWGLSNMGVARSMAYLHACEKLGAPLPVSHQSEYSILASSAIDSGGLAEMCSRHGLGLTPFSPLCHGLLTGKYRNGIPEGSRAARYGSDWQQRRMTPARIAAVEKLAAIADGSGIPMTQLALAWLLTRPLVSSIIIGANRAEQFAQNLKALTVKLAPDTLEAIERVREGLAATAA